MILALVFAALVSLVASQPDIDCLFDPDKSIILMIGDGMGSGQENLGRVVELGPNGTLRMQMLPYLHKVTTRSLDNNITDSAAAASAISTGNKILNYYVALKDGVALRTILEQAKAAGKATGLVTTTTVTHATPASFSSHVTDRNLYSEIARQQTANANVDVLMGGGSTQFDLNAWRAKGYATLGTRADLMAFNTSASPNVQKIIGLFAPDQVPFEFERDFATTPSLTEMVVVALQSLEKAPKGFFLMIEGGRIDHGGHANNQLQMALEEIIFDETVGYVTEWVNVRNALITNNTNNNNSSGDTNSTSNTTTTTNSTGSKKQYLMMVTADHETGGATVVQPGTDIALAPLPLPKANLSSTPEEIRAKRIARANAAVVTWTTTGHTGANVGLYTNLPLSPYILGSNPSSPPVVDNTNIYFIMYQYFTYRNNNVTGSSTSVSSSSTFGWPVVCVKDDLPTQIFQGQYFTVNYKLYDAINSAQDISVKWLEVGTNSEVASSVVRAQKANYTLQAFPSYNIRPYTYYSVLFNTLLNYSNEYYTQEIYVLETNLTWIPPPTSISSGSSRVFYFGDDINISAHYFGPRVNFTFVVLNADDNSVISNLTGTLSVRIVSTMNATTRTITDSLKLLSAPLQLELQDGDEISFVFTLFPIAGKNYPQRLAMSAVPQAMLLPSVVHFRSFNFSVADAVVFVNTTSITKPQSVWLGQTFFVSWDQAKVYPPLTVTLTNNNLGTPFQVNLLQVATGTPAAITTAMTTALTVNNSWPVSATYFVKITSTNSSSPLNTVQVPLSIRAPLISITVLPPLPTPQATPPYTFAAGGDDIRFNWFSFGASSFSVELFYKADSGVNPNGDLITVQKMSVNTVSDASSFSYSPVSSLFDGGKLWTGMFKASTSWPQSQSYAIRITGANYSVTSSFFAVIDIDECQRGTANCSQYATCNNTSPGYMCICNPGWEGDGFTCVDVDECARSVHNCDSNAFCTNTNGGFTCTCNPGYSGTGTVCQADPTPTPSPDTNPSPEPNPNPSPSSNNSTSVSPSFLCWAPNNKGTYYLLVGYTAKQDITIPNGNMNYVTINTDSYTQQPTDFKKGTYKLVSTIPVLKEMKTVTWSVTSIYASSKYVSLCPEDATMTFYVPIDSCNSTTKADVISKVKKYFLPYKESIEADLHKKRVQSEISEIPQKRAGPAAPSSGSSSEPISAEYVSCSDSNHVMKVSLTINHPASPSDGPSAFYVLAKFLTNPTSVASFSASIGSSNLQSNYSYSNTLSFINVDDKQFIPKSPAPSTSAWWALLIAIFVVLFMGIVIWYICSKKSTTKVATKDLFSAPESPDNQYTLL